MVHTIVALNPQPFLEFRLVPFIRGKNKHLYDAYNPPAVSVLDALAVMQSSQYGGC